MGGSAQSLESGGGFYGTFPLPPHYTYHGSEGLFTVKNGVLLPFMFFLSSSFFSKVSSPIWVFVSNPWTSWDSDERCTQFLIIWWPEGFGDPVSWGPYALLNTGLACEYWWLQTSCNIRKTVQKLLAGLPGTFCWRARCWPILCLKKSNDFSWKSGHSTFCLKQLRVWAAKDSWVVFSYGPESPAEPPDSGTCLAPVGVWI